MAGFKRGGFRGGGGGAFKKGFAKKRSSPDDDSAPRASKKVKGDDDDEEEEAALVIPVLNTDADGNQYVCLNSSGKRRVTISDYNKSTLVSIREYWINDGGELKPGKGISLTIDQYNTLLAAAPLIESALAQKDIPVVRPDYDAALSGKVEAQAGEVQIEQKGEKDDKEVSIVDSGDEE
ncbi:transcriptional Coactivator p15-domain-containing protein [Pyrenochaeta sp. MPI-SDFR-AT-0127]|nr:transcriptional Coactivator p15-domain-containing protein [Pyrenochaeta sp. MPI-SDFR-AT-0127]